MNKLSEIKAFYKKQINAKVHPLDALNNVMKEFYSFSFKTHLEEIFTVNNEKTVKGEKKGYLTGIIYLAPAKLSGANVCPMAVIAGCGDPCLNTSGKGKLTRVQFSRLRKTLLYLLNPAYFFYMVEKDMVKLRNKAKRLDYTLALRCNGTSDIAWYKTPMYDLGKKYGAIMYDYTKVVKHIAEKPEDYHMTLSYSESSAYYSDMVKKAIADYPSLNVAVVFREHLPETFLGRKVVNGDETDLRFLDEKGVIVGLTAKGKAKKDYSGFVID